MLESKLKQLPRSAGVYFHKSKSGEIIYVGKAAVLKNRVRQYFQNPRGKDIKTLALVAEIYDTDWLETESEVDALFLESEMVKRYMPRYNVLLRDDKSQLFVRIDMKSEWPYVAFTRNPSDDGAEYFGPFYNGYAVKKALRYLRPVFPYYTREPQKVSSKLEMQIGLNPSTSEGSVAYKANLKRLISYIKGNRKSIAADLEKDMRVAAKQQNFEKAALLRNKLGHMKELQRRVMFGDREFLDISKDRALTDMTDMLMLKSAPERIEGYDISHQSGKNVVASMVVFTNGVSDRAEYRKFKMTKQSNDDYANMYETLFRRFSPKNITSWGKPSLILIDGGKGQLNAALRALRDRALEVPCISISKRNEEVTLSRPYSNIDTSRVEAMAEDGLKNIGLIRDSEHLHINLHPGQINAGGHSKNLRGSESFSRYSDITKLFQRIRDESHRFAVSYHTSLKRDAATKSRLEDVPGVGPVTRQRLMKKYGSLKAIISADYTNLVEIVGEERAKKIKAL